VCSSDLVDATLSFARGIASSEAYETVEMGAFLGQLRADMLDNFSLREGQAVHLRLRPQSVRRALRNLIDNAERYGGTVDVSYGREDDHAIICVRDNGPGIPDADIEQVFEPYFRLEKSRSRETGGNGLGLSIARTIIRAHGGNISLANRVDGGLVATVTLPLEAQSSYNERTMT
jgi:signal transduction histidine kinase